MKNVSLPDRRAPHLSGRILVGSERADEARRIADADRITLGELIGKSLECYVDKYHPEWKRNRGSRSQGKDST